MAKCERVFDDGSLTVLHVRLQHCEEITQSKFRAYSKQIIVRLKKRLNVSNGKGFLEGAILN